LRNEMIVHQMFSIRHACSTVAGTRSCEHAPGCCELRVEKHRPCEPDNTKHVGESVHMLFQAQRGSVHKIPLCLTVQPSKGLYCADFNIARFCFMCFTARRHGAGRHMRIHGVGGPTGAPQSHLPPSRKPRRTLASRLREICRRVMSTASANYRMAQNLTRWLYCRRSDLPARRPLAVPTHPLSSTVPIRTPADWLWPDAAYQNDATAIRATLASQITIPGAETLHLRPLSIIGRSS